MRMVLRNGFAHPSVPFESDDQMDAMIDEAEKQSVVVQGVRCVRMIAGRLLVEFHGGREAMEAQATTGWVNAGGLSLVPTLKPREGGVSVVAKGHAYLDYVIEEAA